MAKSSPFIQKKRTTTINGTLSNENGVLFAEDESGNKTEVANLITDLLGEPLKITFAHSSEEM